MNSSLYLLKRPLLRSYTVNTRLTLLKYLLSNTLSLLWRRYYKYLIINYALRIIKRVVTLIY